MTEQSTRFKVGQKWKRRDGIVVTISEINFMADYLIADGFNYTREGWVHASRIAAERDLVELVSDSAIDSVAEQSTNTPTGAEIYRQIEMLDEPVLVTNDMNIDGYESLANVLQRAYNQAAVGKGVERHSAAGEPFHEQVMQIGAAKFGHGALLFQAFKKSEESQRLPHDRAINELLGAINYLAGAVIALEIKKDTV